MTTNEILLGAIVVLIWAMTLVLAYFTGQIKAFEAAREIAHEVVKKKFEELRKDLKL